MTNKENTEAIRQAIVAELKELDLPPIESIENLSTAFLQIVVGISAQIGYAPKPFALKLLNQLEELLQRVPDIKDRKDKEQNK